ncbi:MAG TPA: hypothetical protein VGB36_16235 [Gammaproteobacteria bacterium]
MKFAAVLALLAAGMLYAPADSAVPACAIEIHPRFNLYVISVGGRPFKNKHYVDYDDAARLHRVLVDAGHCVPAQKIAKCGSPGDAQGRKLVGLAGAGADPANNRAGARLSWSPADCTAQ